MLSLLFFLFCFTRVTAGMSKTQCEPFKLGHLSFRPPPAVTANYSHKDLLKSSNGDSMSVEL